MPRAELEAEPKVPAASGCRLVVDKGRLIAWRIGREVHFGPVPVLEDRAAVEGLLRGSRRDALTS